MGLQRPLFAVVYSSGDLNLRPRSHTYCSTTLQCFIEKDVSVGKCFAAPLTVICVVLSIQ